MPFWGSGQWPYPNASDGPDVAGDLLKLGKRIDLISGAGIGYTATALTRAALVTNGDAFEGLVVEQIDTGVIYRYTSATWQVLFAPKNAQRRTAAQVLATAAASQTVIAWDTAVLPLTSLFTLVAGVFTAVRACVVEVRATVDFAANATGNRGLYVRKNGTPVIGGQTSTTGSAGSIDASLSLVTTVSLAIGDTLDVAANQASGGNLNAFGAVTIEQIG